MKHQHAIRTRLAKNPSRGNGHLPFDLPYSPAYCSPYGAAYVADSRKLLAALPENSVNLAVTSPPYALHFKKEYGNVEKQEYVEWFLPFAREIYRALKPDGSFVLNIGGSFNPGTPTRSLYHFKLLIALVEQVGFHLAQECFWYNPAKLPAPAEWVTVRRQRIKDSVENDSRPVPAAGSAGGLCIRNRRPRTRRSLHLPCELLGIASPLAILSLLIFNL